MRWHRANEKKLDQRIVRKRHLELVSKKLIRFKCSKAFSHNLKYTTPWFIDAMVENRESLIEYLKSKNIGSRIMYPPLNKQKAYNQKISLPNSELVGKKGLWFPSSVQLTNEEVDYISDQIKNFI